MLRERVHQWVLDYPETKAILLDQTTGKMKIEYFMYSADVDRIFDTYHVLSVDITENTHTIIITCLIDD